MSDSDIQKLENLVSDLIADIGLMVEGIIPMLTNHKNTREENQPSSCDYGPHAIDLNALAEKIYMMLREEMRVERERIGRNNY